MITVVMQGGYLIDNKWSATPLSGMPTGKTIAHSILANHDKNKNAYPQLNITFDALASHDITYVGIIQTARASGLTKFALPYILTNCHNSLCAVGGTINEDDHAFGLSAAMRYGGEFVPAHMAVIHQYMREMHASCGNMILGSDSHTRYGALGTLGIGEGGPELVKQLLGKTYDIARPEVVAVWLEGKPRAGVGPQDVALAFIKKVFPSGLVKNKILEFIGPGIKELSVDYRMGIDVMTTETTCLSSIWETDEKVDQWLAIHGRKSAYQKLTPENGAYYDMVIHVDLSRIEPMIALPFHPSNAWTIKEFIDNADDLLEKIEQDAKTHTDEKLSPPSLHKKLKSDGFYVDQCIVAGCSGGMYENMVRMAEIAQQHPFGAGGVDLAIYPASQAQYIELVRSGHAATLMAAGATLKTAFCGPCFGAGDVPANGAFSIRHTTRNFPYREGAIPTAGQTSYVALMDARSIAATAANGGRLTAATSISPALEESCVDYHFDKRIYEARVYQGIQHPLPNHKLVFGPNITDWPTISPLPDNLLLQVASAIFDQVTTTDELIPSGETSSYRSNPLRLAEFTLSRKDPGYVARAKYTRDLENLRLNNALDKERAIQSLFSTLALPATELTTGIGSLVFALKPGDGSAREQAASCQRVLGGWANIAVEYATKRYRSNLVNWGILPFIINAASLPNLQINDYVYIEGVKEKILSGEETFPARLMRDGISFSITLTLPDMTHDERNIILAGCLSNFYASKKI